MPYLVGYTADRGGREALALGRLLALSAGESLIVCTIVPETWGYPSPARVDAEYAAFLDRHARRALARVRATLGVEVQADMVARSASSVVAGLAGVAEDTRAALIVLGSARHGPVGRFTVGSVTEGLQQVAPVPVALAPKGYRPAADTRVPRITCAWAPVPGSDAVLAAATALCREHHAPLRLATLVVRDRQMYPSGVGYDIENMVANEWRAEAQAAQRKALMAVPADVAATGAIGDGSDWRKALEALDWLPGEPLLVGSSHRGAIARILLGADSGRIIRSARAPVIVLPRAAEAAAAA